jgi:hypothetical protein
MAIIISDLLFTYYSQFKSSKQNNMHIVDMPRMHIKALNVLTDYASSRIQVLSPALAGRKACPNRIYSPDPGWRFSH